MEQLFEYLNTTNLQTLLGMFIISWYFTRDLKVDMHRMHEELVRQGQRTDDLYKLFVEQQKGFDQKFYDILKERKNP